jgi:GNAT superfamily N-acetyltransferase
MISFRLISDSYLEQIVHFIEILNDYKIEKVLIKERVLEMFAQSYECIGIFDDDEIVGVCGLWYMTRHYSGRSVEIDHVYISETYRNKGLGKDLFNWLETYLKKKKIETLELNTYVGNPASHKFYYNQGFKILGFHFLKTL